MVFPVYGFPKIKILFEVRFLYVKNSFLTESGFEIIPEGQCHLNKGIVIFSLFFGFAFEEFTWEYFYI